MELAQEIEHRLRGLLKFNDLLILALDLRISDFTHEAVVFSDPFKLLFRLELRQ